MTKAELVERIHGLGSEHSRSRLTRMPKAELERLGHKLQLHLDPMSVDEFIRQTRAKTLPTYSGAGYWPSYLAPNGQILVGDSHNSITFAVKRAHDSAEWANYTFMAKRGFIRLVPDSDWSALSFETNRSARPTEAQIETLRKLAAQVDWRSGERSYVDNKRVFSADELMAVARGQELSAAA